MPELPASTFAARCVSRAQVRDRALVGIGLHVASVSPEDLLWVAEGVENGIGVVSRSPLQELAETSMASQLVRDVLLTRHVFLGALRDEEPDPAMVVGFDDRSPTNATCQVWFYARSGMDPEHISLALAALADYTRANWNLRAVYLSLPGYIPDRIALQVRRVGKLEGQLPLTAYAREALWDEEIIALR